MSRTLAPIALALLGLAGCSNEPPSATEPLAARPAFAKGAGQTLYALTFTTDIQTGSVIFSGLAKTGDPFLGIGGDNVLLTLPAATSGNTAVCDGDGSGLGATTNSWGGYVGEWKGTLSITKKRGLIYFSYRANPADGSAGFLNLDSHAAFTETNSGGVVTIAISNARGMVGATSTPDGSGFDAAGSVPLLLEYRHAVNQMAATATELALFAGACVTSARAQSPDLRPLVQAILVGTTSYPIPGSAHSTELRLVQPLLGGDARLLHGRLHLTVTLNLEGAVIPEGEIALGDWGEGFVDRRHPHTFTHEVMAATTIGRRASFELGIAAGKGFVPFGSDDPMSRPALRYPVNHHWAQILERAAVITQLRWSTVVAEAALFNGDEPERPGQWPNVGRFGDSWSVRLSVTPWTWLELQGSRAHVHSPEHRPGAGLDQEKASLSARVERSIGSNRHLYALAEWARTNEFSGFLSFHSLLGETAVRQGRQSLYYRFERTERPEESRFQPFRSIRPHRENDILGTSRWTTHTAGYRVSLAPVGARWSFEPFAEGTLGGIAKVGGGLFAVSDWYESSRFWSLSVGSRAGVGLRGHRMGRYGVASEPPAGTGHH